jgi:hypothetical protein
MPPTIIVSHRGPTPRPRATVGGHGCVPNGGERHVTYALRYMYGVQYYGVNKSVFVLQRIAFCTDFAPLT